MTILFIASEPGSARAILPVALCCRAAGHALCVTGRGCMATEAAALGLTVSPCPETAGDIDALLVGNGVRAVVFSSNVKDALPLAVARRAAEHGLGTVHVLDYWNGYTGRMTLDGRELFVPAVYAVPDELAKHAAGEAGIPASCLRVTGQPAFADICASVRPAPATLRTMRQACDFDPDLPLLLFVSEPVSSDQGENPDGPDYRGYTERTVLALLMERLRPLADRLQLAALAHPREDKAGLERDLLSWRGALSARLITPPRGRDALAMVDGVVGMASTLLYEAWLNGLPVASLQPGLRQPALATMRQREGVFFADTEALCGAPLEAWLTGIKAGRPGAARPEARLHADASDILCGIVAEFVPHRQSPRNGAPA